MKELKIRASQVGKIMTTTRAKSNLQKYNETKDAIETKSTRLRSLSSKAQKSIDKLTTELGALTIKLSELEPIKNEVELSDTTKSLLESIFWEREFGIYHEITSKYFDKGNDQENASIELASKVNKWKNAIKNEERFENDFLTGTPDLILPTMIVDIKTSWTSNSFPLKNKEDEIPNQDYFYQLQSYLALTDKLGAVLSYCLVDTPENLIQDELFKYARNNGLIECPDEVEDSIRTAHTYSNLPQKIRVKNFPISRDEEIIEKIYQRVEDCRKWYDENLLSQIF